MAGNSLSILCIDPVWGALLPKRQAGWQEQSRMTAAILNERDYCAGVIKRSDALGLLQSSLSARVIEVLVQRSAARLVNLRLALAHLAGPADTAVPDRERVGPDYEREMGQILAQGVECWATGAELMHVICQARGIRYVHVLQPTLYDKDSKILSEREKQIPPPTESWLIGARMGFPMLRARSSDLIAKGITFIDASRVFEGLDADLYYDPCHFNETGNRLLQQYIEARLCAAIFPP
jgi:hypothetical protein